MGCSEEDGEKKAAPSHRQSSADAAHKEPRQHAPSPACGSGRRLPGLLRGGVFRRQLPHQLIKTDVKEVRHLGELVELGGGCVRLPLGDRLPADAEL